MSQTETQRSSRGSSVRDFKLALLLVGLVGLSGSAYVLSSINSTANRSQEEVVLVKQRVSSKKAHIIEFSDQVSVVDETQFTIANYNSDLAYSMDFGDGTIRKISTPLFTHKYEKEGEFETILKIEYQENVSIIDKRIITVKNPVSTDTNP